MEKPTAHHRRRPVLGAALISSLGIYCRVPILRGAIFGLFPGLASRSLRLSVRGALVGALIDASYLALWATRLSRTLNIYWEPREGYNRFLALWLPGRRMVITHTGSPWSNVAQFHVGIMLWLSAMVLGWWYVWRPRLSLARLGLVLVTCNVAAYAGCSLLWTVSPMDHWWPLGATPYGDLHGVPWLIVFLSVFPICGVLTAALFSRRSVEED